MNLEVETKLSASADFQLPLTQLETLGFTLSIEPLQDTATTYFDTKQHDLLAGGAALRFRSLASEEGMEVGTWALKFSAHQYSHVTSRYEFEIEGSSQSIPRALKEALRVYGATDLLEPIATLRALRQTIYFLNATSEIVFALDDDWVAVGKGPNSGSEFREIEVELRSQTHESGGDAIVELLCDAGAQFAVSSSKLEQAIANESNMQELKVHLKRYTAQESADLTALALLVLLDRKETGPAVTELARLIVAGMSERSAQKLVGNLVQYRLSNSEGILMEAIDGAAIDVAESLRLGKWERLLPLEYDASNGAIHQIVSAKINSARKRGADSIGEVSDLLKDIFDAPSRASVGIDGWFGKFAEKWS